MSTRNLFAAVFLAGMSFYSFIPALWADTDPQRPVIQIESGTADEFIMDPHAKLGQVDGVLTPDELGIREYGLTTAVKQKWTFDGVKTAGLNLVYPSTVKEIFWFAQFNISQSFKNNFQRSMRAEWFSPDGKLYSEKRFKVSLLNETFVKTSLKLPQPLDPMLIGRWRVRVWRKDKLIDDRYFEIR